MYADVTVCNLCKNVEFLTFYVFVGGADDSVLPIYKLNNYYHATNVVHVFVLCTFNDALGSLRDPDPLGGVERELPRPNPLHDLLRT